MAPPFISVPSGRDARLDYQADGTVTAAVKLQELFGLADTPRVGPRRVPVLLALLAPNGRPVQMTRDLRSFWDPHLSRSAERTSGPLSEASVARGSLDGHADGTYEEAGGQIEKEQELVAVAADSETGVARAESLEVAPSALINADTTLRLSTVFLRRASTAVGTALLVGCASLTTARAPGLLRPSRRAVRGVLECLGSVRRAGRDDQARGHDPKVTFTVLDGFRGVTASTLEVSTEPAGQRCSLPFRVGHEYIVYAARSEGGALTTSRCLRTRDVEDAGADLAYARDVKQGTRRSGTDQRSSDGRAARLDGEGGGTADAAAGYRRHRRARWRRGHAW